MPAWQWHMGASQRSGPTCNKHHLQTSSISPCGLLLSAHLDACSRTAGGRSPLPDPPPSSAQACQDSTQTSWQHVCRHPTATLGRSLQICGACDHTSETRSAHLTDQRCTALCTRTKSSLKRATFLVGTDDARRSCRQKITASGDHPRPQNYSRNHLTNNITKMTL